MDDKKGPPWSLCQDEISRLKRMEGELHKRLGTLDSITQIRLSSSLLYLQYTKV